MIKLSTLESALLCVLVFTPLCKGQALTETWWGTATAPSLWGGLELTLSRNPGEWNASGRLKFQGRERAAPVSDLKVDGGQIGFKMSWENLQLSFTGQMEGNRYRGTFATDVDGKPVSGDWSLIRLTIPSASERIELPAPTGPYSVGRMTLHWVDQNREETETKEKGDKRELLIHLWYPAARFQSNAIYLPDWKEMGQELPRQAAAAMRELRVDAQENAQVATAPGRFPVVIFSPGQGVKTLFYSSLQADLASHGFLVAAVEHTYDSPVVVFPDGRILRPLPKQKSTASTTPSQDLQIQHDAADYRAQDIIFVKKKLAELTGSGKSVFGNRLDLSKVAVVGHSLGGMAALRACQLDAGIRACANIDGGYRARPYPSDKAMGAAHQSLMWLRRPLYVFTDGQLKGIGMTREEFNAEVSLGHRVLGGANVVALDVQFPQVGIDHMYFSDVRVLESGVSPEGHAARLLTLEATRDWVSGFVQKAFDGRTTFVFTETAAKYREAQVSLYQ